MTRRQFLCRAGAAGCFLAASGAGTVRGLGTGASVTGLHEAMFYDRLEADTVLCRLCPKGCIVADGKRGRCRVRENRGGTYYSLVYGRPCTRAIDPIEKKPFFHVYPGTVAASIATVGCNIACAFCQNWDISQAGPEDFTVDYVEPAAIAAWAERSHARMIAYTYSEPTVFFEYMADCARAGRERGLESVVVSNGYITAEAQKALFPLVRAIKIDLKAFTDDFYRKVCDGTLPPVLDSLRRLKGSGVWFEIVLLILPTLNDGEEDARRLTAWVVKELGPDVPLHFSRFHPQYKMKNLPPTPPDTLRRLRQIALEAGCRFVYIGNVPGEEAQHTYCPSCKAPVIKRYAYTILENNLVGGSCKACGHAVPGVWPAADKKEETRF